MSTTVDRTDEFLELYADEAAPDPAEDRGPQLWRATDLEPARRLDWLAARRIPKASVTYMLGPEGIGKSLFTVWLAAIVSTGRGCPEFGIPARPPGIVAMVITEDDWATVVRPRLEVAGADLDMVRVLCTDPDGSGAPTFPHHMSILEDTPEPLTLVMVDAWADTLPSGLTVKDPQQARRALHPWKELATRTGTAVLLSGHTNRESTGNVRNAYGLTGELRKKARMTILAQPDEDETGATIGMLIGPEKSNLVGPVPASRFRIDSVQVFDPSEASDGTVPALVWVGDGEQTLRDYFADAADTAEDRDDRTSAAAWLEDYLTKEGRARRADVIAAAQRARVGSESTIKRAFKTLRGVSDTSGFPREAHWSLPDPPGQSDHRPPDCDPTEGKQAPVQTVPPGHGQSGQSGHHLPLGDAVDPTVEGAR